MAEEKKQQMLWPLAWVKGLNLRDKPFLGGNVVGRNV
jgi:hypothetical protein